MIVFDLMAFSWGFNGVLMVCASSSVSCWFKLSTLCSATFRAVSSSWSWLWMDDICSSRSRWRPLTSSLTLVMASKVASLARSSDCVWVKKLDCFTLLLARHLADVSCFIWNRLQARLQSPGRSNSMQSGPSAKLKVVCFTSLSARCRASRSVKQSKPSNGSWRQGIKGEMTCTVYVALVWDIIYWIIIIIMIIIIII